MYWTQFSNFGEPFFKDKSRVEESMDDSLEEGSAAAETWGHTWRGLAPCWTLVCKRGDPPTALLYITPPANNCLRPPPPQLSKVFYMPKAPFCHRREISFFFPSCFWILPLLLQSSFILSEFFSPSFLLAVAWQVADRHLLWSLL